MHQQSKSRGIFLSSCFATVVGRRKCLDSLVSTFGWHPLHANARAREINCCKLSHLDAIAAGHSRVPALHNQFYIRRWQSKRSSEKNALAESLIDFQWLYRVCLESRSNWSPSRVLIVIRTAMLHQRRRKKSGCSIPLKSTSREAWNSFCDRRFN